MIHRGGPDVVGQSAQWSSSGQFRFAVFHLVALAVRSVSPSNAPGIPASVPDFLMIRPDAGILIGLGVQHD